MNYYAMQVERHRRIQAASREAEFEQLTKEAKGVYISPRRSIVASFHNAVTWIRVRLRQPDVVYRKDTVLGDGQTSEKSEAPTEAVTFKY